MRRLLLLSPILLAACSGNDVTRTLGLGQHHAPDEYEVVSRPPLSVPKEFSLRAPEDGSDAPPSGVEAPVAARRQVTGLDAASASNSLESSPFAAADTAVPLVRSSDLPSNGQSAFLNRIGADKADPKIRSELHSENADPARTKNPSFLDKLQGVSNTEPEVNASAEAARIKQNKAADKPLTTGDTPTVDSGDKTVLQRIFN